MINSNSKGKNYELKIIKELKELLQTEDIMSTRLGSRDLDNKKVDIMGKVPFNIQCKATEKLIKPHDILSSMPDDKIPTIFWKKNYKDEIIFMKKSDFYKLLSIYDEFCIYDKFCIDVNSDTTSTLR